MGYDKKQTFFSSSEEDLVGTSEELDDRRQVESGEWSEMDGQARSHSGQKVSCCSGQSSSIGQHL